MAFKQVEEDVSAFGMRIRLEEGSQLRSFCPKNQLEMDVEQQWLLSPYNSETLSRGHMAFLDVAKGMRTVDI